jgi:hypothetical protein
MIKLIYTFIFSLLSINCLLFGQLRAGFDISGDFKMAAEGESVTYDAESGIVIGYDAVMQDEGVLKLGVGGEFMIGRGVEEYAEGKGAFHSIYGFGKYSLNEKAYGLGRIGYNFHTGDDDYKDYGVGINTELTGGLMYAIGGGFSITPKMALEGLFASHSGGITLSANGEEAKVKVTYTRISLGLVFIL